jgi:hypothetical protein
MPTEVDESRDLARAFWAGRDLICPRHGVKMKATFVQTTYADHIACDCPTGKESFTINQRPRQMEFNAHQIEGLVVFIQRNDSIRCYRCQSKLQVDARPDPQSGVTRYAFTCIRCFSYGFWEGRPEKANVVGVTEALEESGAVN